ncbi:MAG TPA: transporter [Ruminococcus sp.]|nr:transporter [Ruminococcus sp.]
MKRTNIKYYAMLHALLLLFSMGGIFSKLAAHETFLSLRWMLLYGGLLAIMAMYAIFWQQILRHIPLSSAYVCRSVTIIWGMLWGILFFEEHLTAANLIGGGLVLAGVLLVVTGNRTS